MKSSDDVITLYTLKDADEVLKRKRHNRRMQVMHAILDPLDKVACALIIPGAVAAVLYLFF